MKIVLFLAGILSACAPLWQSQSAVRLTAEPAGAGTVRLTLHNDSAEPVGYNLCPSVLERRDDTTWNQVMTDEVCTMELRTLQPSRTATFDKRFPSNLTSGEYRYVTSVEAPLGTSQNSVVSNSFRVR